MRTSRRSAPTQPPPQRPASSREDRTRISSPLPRDRRRMHNRVQLFDPVFRQRQAAASSARSSRPSFTTPGPNFATIASNTVRSRLHQFTRNLIGRKHVRAKLNHHGRRRWISRSPGRRLVQRREPRYTPRRSFACLHRIRHQHRNRQRAHAARELVCMR